MSHHDSSPTAHLPFTGHAPTATYSDSLPDAAEALLVPLFTGDDGLELVGVELWDVDTNVEVWNRFVAVGATGATNEVTIVPSPEDTGVAAIIGVGLGAEDKLTDEVLRRAAGVAIRAAAGFGTIATTLGAFGLTAAVEGIVLGGYRYRGYRAEKTTPTTKKPVDTVVFITPTGLYGQQLRDEDLAAEGLSADDRAALAAAGVELPSGSAGDTDVSEKSGKKGKKGKKARKAARKAAEALAAGDATAAAVASGAYDPKLELVRAQITAEAVLFARDLVNTPPLDLYPESYAAIAEAAAREHGLKVQVLDEKQLKAGGYGGILAVGRGSSRGPRLVRISYSPKKATRHVALVGKGITFDTGGISLKPGKGMSDMTCDMAGSAAMIAAVIAAARLKVKVAVTATIPLAENMPGGNAQRPGDVITHYGGLTSEVLNTDAEGRLVLADAIARACEDEPDYLIETATLTGAQMAALGLRTAGVMGSDDFRERIAALGCAVGENALAVPIPEEVREDVTGSDIADVRNIAVARYAGMQAAGAYLEAAVTGSVQWAHIDVAGPAWNGTKTYGYTPTRGTGCPVRTVLAALEDIATFG